MQNSPSKPWTLLKGALSVAFLYYGVTKLTGTAGTVALYEAIGFGQFPRYVTGSVETLGAIGLWIPGLQAIAALVLTLTMIVGLTTMVMIVGGFWGHLALLLVLTALLTYGLRHQLPLKRRVV
jgi:uncharacterized membrane protein